MGEADQQAMLDANGRLVMFERIPHDVVEEALADIVELATARRENHLPALHPTSREQMPEPTQTIGGLYA